RTVAPPADIPISTWWGSRAPSSQRTAAPEARPTMCWPQPSNVDPPASGPATHVNIHMAVMPQENDAQWPESETRIERSTKFLTKRVSGEGSGETGDERQ